MAVITNKEVLALCKDDPSFKGWTGKLTDEMFTAAGFEELLANDYRLLADFFNLSIRVVLQKIKTPRPRIPGVYKSLVEEYSNLEGGIFQRINTKLIKPTSPKYRNLVNGGSVDPFVVRKPETEERFYKQNFDYQNMLTIQNIELKKMFLSEGGINDYVSGILKSLDDAYVIQKFETMKELLSKAINSTQNPLKASQRIQVPDIVEGSTNADCAKFIQVFQNLYDLMEDTVVSGAFNAKSYEHGLYPEEYVLLVRSDIWNYIKTTLMATTYHTENLGVKFEVKPVKDFGGLTFTNTSGTPLLPVYDDFGAVKGFNTTGTGDPLPEDQLVKVDPNPNVSALLIQKGALFTTEQAPYQTESIYNPAGKYTNLWASQPNSSFNYDACYDMITFIKPLTTVVNPTVEPETP